jgi:putative endopeptidase
MTKLFSTTILSCLCSCLAAPPLFAQVNSQDFLDQTAIDSTIRPQDDFFNYANGGWLQRTAIPADLPAWGGAITLQIQSLTNIHRMLDSLSRQTTLVRGTIEQQTADLYTSFMDSAALEARGLAIVNKYVSRIDTIKDVPALIREIAREKTEGNSHLFVIRADADDRNSQWEMARFEQGAGALGLPSREYYSNGDTSFVRLRLAYRDYIARILVLAGETGPKAQKDAAAVVRTESEIARISRSAVALRDMKANYHKMTVRELDRLTPGLRWKDFFTDLGIHQDTIIMGQPEFFAGLVLAFQSLPLSDWKQYLKFHLIDYYGGWTSARISAAQSSFDMLLSGSKQDFSRWEQAVFQVSNLLPDAVGQLYVKRFFPPEAKQRILEMINKLQAAFANRILGLDWMSDATKQKAIDKLNAIVKKIGYPDTWQHYSSIAISRDNLIGGIVNCKKYAYARMIDKLGKPVDHSSWQSAGNYTMTPTTVDADYNRTTNEIIFPAAILQPPFFYMNGDDAINYAGIGFVIAHEITHGFDDKGSQYDARGNLENWWTPVDSSRFREKTDQLALQYSHYIEIDTFHVDGRLTLGENIADLGGLSIAYDAFKQTPEGKDTTRIYGLTPDQRFFMAFAQANCVKSTPEYVKANRLSDEHSPARVRVDAVLSNLDPFYVAYKLTPADKMYQADNLRVHIW